MKHPWPAEGTRRFLHDLLLWFTQKQWLLQVQQWDDKEGRGWDRVFADEANITGRRLGLPQVVVSPRLWEQPDGYPWYGWPQCVRPTGYYADDLTQELVEIAARGKRRSATASERK